MKPLVMFILAAMWCAAAFPAASAQASAAEGASESVVVPVFDEALIEWDRATPEGAQHDGYSIHREGQMLQRVVEFPAMPDNQRNAQRIIATLIVEPVIHDEGGKLRPGDPWTRLGTVSIARKPAAATTPATPQAEPPAEAQPSSGTQTAGPQIAATPETPSAAASSQSTGESDIEIMRFVTGFGGYGTFTQDVTDLAPLLHGSTTVRVFISTYRKPAWKVTLTFNFTGESPGYRRPVWAVPVINEEALTSQRSKVSATIDIPKGLARPRLRIVSTGHATDGTGGDEFVSRTHVLRVDGLEVARWRPWVEDSGTSHDVNPMSGRVDLDGRELWSSDLDRSGWRPGTIVQPLRIPVAELTPGTHTIELEILNIRPKDQLGHHGYWRVSCIAVADEPWPERSESSP